MAEYIKMESRPTTAAVDDPKISSEHQHDIGTDTVTKTAGDVEAHVGKTDEQTFPPLRTVIVVMMALYLAMFLVSLVSPLSSKSCLYIFESLLTLCL